MKIKEQVKTCWKTAQYRFGRSISNLMASGLGMAWIVLIILLVIVAGAALLGCLGGMIIGLPALVIYLAFNWVVPAFGGPTIAFKVAIGLVLLLPIVYHLLHGRK